MEAFQRRHEAASNSSEEAAVGDQNTITAFDKESSSIRDKSGGVLENVDAVGPPKLQPAIAPRTSPNVRSQHMESPSADKPSMSLAQFNSITSLKDSSYH